VWQFGGPLALLFIGVVTVPILAVVIWAIVDACHHPEVAWSRSGQSRPLWVMALVGGWLVTSLWLRHHYSVGRLSYDELLQRLDEAYAARTVAGLEQALRELPPW
jgi:hypothetical protein